MCAPCSRPARSRGFYSHAARARFMEQPALDRSLRHAGRSSGTAEGRSCATKRLPDRDRPWSGGAGWPGRGDILSERILCGAIVGFGGSGSADSSLARVSHCFAERPEVDQTHLGVVARGENSMGARLDRFHSAVIECFGPVRDGGRPPRPRFEASRWRSSDRPGHHTPVHGPCAGARGTDAAQHSRTVLNPINRPMRSMA